MINCEQIRQNVFETNSSSSHSLTVSSLDIRQTDLVSKSAAESGVLTIYLGDYGWEYHRYYTFVEKVAYLATQELNGSSEGDHSGYASASFDMLKLAVKNLTGCELRVEGSGCVDHESVGVGGELYKSQEVLEAFLINSASFIQTGNDNSGAPWIIRSDLGPVPLFKEYYAQVPAEHISCAFKLLTKMASGLVTNDGRVIGPDAHPEIFKKIVEQGVLVKVVAAYHPGYTHYDSVDVRKAEAVSSIQGVVGVWDSPDDYYNRTAIKLLSVSESLDYSEVFDSTLEDKWDSSNYCVIKLPKDLVREIEDAKVYSIQDVIIAHWENRISALIADLNEELSQPTVNQSVIDRKKQYIEAAKASLEKAKQGEGNSAGY